MTEQVETPAAPLPSRGPAYQPSPQAPLDIGANPRAEDAGERNAPELLEPADAEAFENLRARRAPQAPADAEWEDAEEPAPAQRQASTKRIPAKRGRKPDPRSPRAARTYQDMLARAHLKPEGEPRRIALEEAHSFGRAAGLLPQEKAPPAAPTPQAPSPAPGAAQQAPPAGAPAEGPKPEQGPTFSGQPAERVALYANALKGAVEHLVSWAQSSGVDVDKDKERVLFRGHPTLERKLTGNPVERLLELAGAEMADRFGAKDGAPSDPRRERRSELKVLVVVTFAPVLLKAVPTLGSVATLALQGVKSAAGVLFRRRR
ncbi:hypothetical protein [Hyalangium gracile]|uniref:hypothetical protein n=1 Tax=Hyalangium gracile TaxID=394092 RepID=UPI001CCA7DA0|nr:hypothetical protein [Hyalangium gracile]